ncbi:hypothetical protein IU434_26355 [Nocardia farcinica]|uniref:hypothetical protein n=1 Tax=Nocardia farcinica TaxID=37329 RepID=UPI001894C240|nr:hypothetical protein [Nocardia farcinica]MBF6445530.1 hypothetical protein [Nocardia farcinica]
MEKQIENGRTIDQATFLRNQRMELYATAATLLQDLQFRNLKLAELIAGTANAEFTEMSDVQRDALIKDHRALVDQLSELESKTALVGSQRVLDSLHLAWSENVAFHELIVRYAKRDDTQILVGPGPIGSVGSTLQTARDFVSAARDDIGAHGDVAWPPK